MRAESAVQCAAHPNFLSSERGQRSAGRLERRLRLARGDDRKGAAPAQIKIEARTAEANPAHHALDNDKAPVAPRQRGGVVGGEHDIIGIAPDAKSFRARRGFQGESAGLAAARLVFRTNPRQAGGDQRLGGRGGRGVGNGRDEVAKRAVPAVGGGDDKR